MRYINKKIEKDTIFDISECFSLELFYKCIISIDQYINKQNTHINKVTSKCKNFRILFLNDMELSIDENEE